MPSVTTPGLSTAPTGVTSFVPSLRVIALLDGSTFRFDPRPASSASGPASSRPGAASSARPVAGPAFGRAFGRAPRRQRSPGSASRRTARTCSCVQPSCDACGLVVRLSPDHEMSAVGALLDVDRRVRERLGYFVVDEQHRASVVLNDLVIVLHRVGKDPQARIRAADT